MNGEINHDFVYLIDCRELILRQPELELTLCSCRLGSPLSRPEKCSGKGGVSGKKGHLDLPCQELPLAGETPETPNDFLMIMDAASEADFVFSFLSFLFLFF